jgi:pimeloyl-ACP methyl ester carboxylesterase
MLECKLENHTIRYLSFGEGNPIIIMHGGGPNDHHYMQTDLEPLFEKRMGWQRIYVDLPGHGQTLWPEWVTSSDQILDMLCDFIDQVIPDRKFTLAGLSWGGEISLGIVSRRAQQVEGLYLSVPAVNVERSERKIPEDTILVKNPDFVTGLQEDERWITEVITVQDPSFLERLRREIFSVSIVNDKNGTNWEITASIFSYDAKKIFLDKPTLILTGRQDDRVGYQDAWDLVENFPRATFAVLDRASHFLSIEQNALMKALIDEWLDRVEEDRHLSGGKGATAPRYEEGA